MNPNPYGRKYPGAGAMPQANPSDGGVGGIGSDSLGTQFRDWGVNPILARLTAHGTTAAYSFEEVYLSDGTGTYSTLPNGVVGTNRAFEVNANAAVTAGTTTGMIVELWPNYGNPGYWSFMAPGAGFATTCKTVATAITCVDGELVITYDLVRVIDQVCT